MAELELKNINKQFGKVTVIPELSLDVADGEFVVLVGPSGCGKSTLLRMIAGLEEISGGEMLLDGQLANDLPPQRRDISMVFQSYALFPHMSARKNITFGPRIRGEGRDRIQERTKRAASILNLDAYLDRAPGQLSGGQRQRVAMGRSIVRDPKVFLFDEPLSNLDAKLRIAMRTEIKALHQKLGTTTVYVTHDQIEAMTMADRIVVMQGGRIEQVGAPLDLYDRPVNKFVAGFIGSPAMSFLPARYKAEGSGKAVFESGAELALGTIAAEDDQKVSIGIRPENYRVAPDGALSLRVEVIEPTGPETLVFGTMEGEPIRCVFRDRLEARPGDTLTLHAAPEHVHVFAADSGERLGP
ncbi:ABC transporter ATP-binding protein [Pelagibacterium montanilacus]|uniref:ABC transporter ATP-binding protein n=1 Tax=Pelagibacterium montanilacus TaxID=2185280 RepID=UPI000F8C7F90|nr:sn-glycerol-3-phosphate ABC transporter ATP-binding protein UgpC [Pelagibacterium montanilacus]